jgi:hypothetical protein
MEFYRVTVATRTIGDRVCRGWIVERVGGPAKVYAASVIFKTEAEARAEKARLHALEPAQ